MFDINKNDLTLLTMEYNEESQVKKILAEAIKGNIKLHFQDFETDSFKCLLSWQIEKIRQKYPNQTEIVLEKPRYYTYEGSFGVQKTALESFARSQKLGVNDLWINKKEADAFIAKLEEILGTKVDSEKLNRYSTPSMVLMYKAIEKFWLNHGPNNPPPKSEIIIDWLVNQEVAFQKVSVREAEAIDSIIRPPEHKKGGNKAQVKRLKSAKV